MVVVGGYEPFFLRSEKKEINVNLQDYFLSFSFEKKLVGLFAFACFLFTLELSLGAGWGVHALKTGFV